MIEKTEKTFRCEFCRKLYVRKNYCIEHILKCRKNPENKQMCLEGCRFLEKKKTVFHFDIYGGSSGSNVEVLFCTAKNQGVYPYWVDGFPMEDIFDGEIENNPMPKECSQYKLFEY